MVASKRNQFSHKTIKKAIDRYNNSNLSANAVAEEIGMSEANFYYHLRKSKRNKVKVKLNDNCKSEKVIERTVESKRVIKPEISTTTDGYITTDAEIMNVMRNSNKRKQKNEYFFKDLVPNEQRPPKKYQVDKNSGKKHRVIHSIDDIIDPKTNKILI